MFRTHQLLWTMVVSLSCGSIAVTVEAAPRVPGFERFHTAEAPQAGGRLLVQELNCLSCHKGEAPVTGVGTKQAPVLDDIGGRVRPEWIQTFLANPHAAKPGTTMPDVLAGLTAEQRATTVAALTHFLASTGSVSDTHPDQSAALRGKNHFHRVGCAACHNPLDKEGVDLPTSVALPDLGKKYTSTSLAAFLKDPHKSRPSGRMPALGLKDDEYRDLAQFFVREVLLSPNVEFAAYHGNWEKLPDFATLKPVKTGQCAGFDLTVAGQPNNFAVRFKTNFYVKAPAQHQFYLGSDDGSRLIIDGETIVDNDGIHAHGEVKGRHSFDVGWHEVVVEYFQGGGEWTLDVDLDGNGLKRQPLAGIVSLTKEPPKPGSAAFSVDPALAEQGRGLFESLGCAACHQLKVDGKALVAKTKAKAWDQLQGAAGCLAETPGAGQPRYAFNEIQRNALAAVTGAGAMQPSPTDLVHHTLTTFNCYACHKRGEIGGAEEARDAYFLTAQKEMGDEGRLPPPLTGVGDKLRDGWLKQVLEQGANDRQLYMQSKMPKYGGRNVGHLVEAFAKVDRQPDPLPEVTFDEPEYRIKAAGRHLVGAAALSCIKCHDFAQHPSQGVRAISLTTMDRRLRPEWFHRYLRDPQAFRPGTRMPSPWPFGTTTVRDVLKANVDAQIRAVAIYLADGDKAAVPVGLVREPIELKAAGTPILYRNFIEGAGSRAIGVGYPEHTNLAWDANDMRLALIWHGAFIDASRHWNGRGVGYEGPLGDDVLPMPTGQPLAQLDSVNASWPGGSARDNGFHFRGYSLNEQQQPTFRYTVGKLEVTDFPKPVDVPNTKYAHLQRTLTVNPTAAADGWYYRAATAGKIELIAPGDYRIDGVWTLTIKSDAVPILRDSQGKSELLVPLTLRQQPVTITLQYAW